MSRAALTEVTLGSASEAGKRGDSVLAWLRRSSEASMRGGGSWDPAPGLTFPLFLFSPTTVPSYLGARDSHQR